MKTSKRLWVLLFVVALVIIPIKESHSQVSVGGMVIQKILEDMLEVLLQVELIKNMSQFELDNKINKAYSEAKEKIDKYYEKKIKQLEDGFQKRQANRKSDGTPEGIKKRNEENDRDFLKLSNDRFNVRSEWEAALEELENQRTELRRACWEIRKDLEVTTY